MQTAKNASVQLWYVHCFKIATDEQLTPALELMGTVKLASVDEFVEVWLYRVAALKRLVLVHACSKH